MIDAGKAARGFAIFSFIKLRFSDVKDIRFVINYDFANNTEDYVHRIGRTGRAGRDGTAYTFFTAKNARQASDLVKILDEANQDVPSRLRDMARFGGGGGGGGGVLSV